MKKQQQQQTKKTKEERNKQTNVAITKIFVRFLDPFLNLNVRFVFIFYLLNKLFVESVYVKI